MTIDPLAGFDSKQAMACKYLTGYLPLESSLCVMHLVYSLPDGRCFTFSHEEEDTVKYLGTIEEIEKDRAENDGRWFGLLPAERLGDHAPADKKLYMSCGAEICKDLEILESEFPESPGISARIKHLLPIEHQWGRAFIDKKERLKEIQQYLLDLLIRLSCDLLREDALPRAYRAAHLAWSMDARDQRAWALILESADTEEHARMLSDLALLHHGVGDKPLEESHLEELRSLADHLLYD